MTRPAKGTVASKSCEPQRCQVLWKLINRFVFKAHTFSSLRGFSLSPPVAPLWGGKGEGEQCVIAAGVNQSQEGEGGEGGGTWIDVSSPPPGEGRREKRGYKTDFDNFSPSAPFPLRRRGRGKRKGKMKKKSLNIVLREDRKINARAMCVCIFLPFAHI